MSFQMPKPVSVIGRASSITNSFINSIIPVIQPTTEEVVEALTILGINPENVTCAYCGDRATEWDHLRPLVMKQRPTGYISEIANLVPVCGKCNQSKGNKPWRIWITSAAPQSPKVRKVLNLESKIERLQAYENRYDVRPLNFEQIVGSELWTQHWENWRCVIDDMKKSQVLASQIRTRIRAQHAA